MVMPVGTKTYNCSHCAWKITVHHASDVLVVHFDKCPQCGHPVDMTRAGLIETLMARINPFNRL